MPPPANLIIRAARITDLQSIASIVATSPDAGATWAFPGWTEAAAQTTPIHAKAFGEEMFASRRYLLRVAEVEGDVVGYVGWVRRRKEADGEVVTEDISEPYDAEALAAEIAAATASLPSPPPRLQTILPPVPARQTAIYALRALQSPEPCTLQPSHQLYVLGVASTHQGLGIGGALIREGIAAAEASGLPLFVTGEGRGMRVYMHLGFQTIRGTWHGYDEDGEEVKEVGEGEGRLEAAQMVYVPKGREAVVGGETYSG